MTEALSAEQTDDLIASTPAELCDYACFHCGREMELSQLFICECNSALFCSSQCSELQPCEQHLDAAKTPAADDAPSSRAKRRRGDADLTAAQTAARQALQQLKQTAAWKSADTLERYRQLQANVQLPAKELIRTLTKLHPPNFYPYVLHNQAVVSQAPLDLRGPPTDPTVVAMLSSAQRVIADTWGPWSKTKGGYAKWETGVGKTPLLHAIAKNYRHQQIAQPDLINDHLTTTVLENCTVLVVTQPHLRGDVMKGLWAQNNRDPAWITAKIRAAGLASTDQASPFSSANVITGRQLTNAMEGVGPLGRALWSGLPIGQDRRVGFIVQDVTNIQGFLLGLVYVF